MKIPELRRITGESYSNYLESSGYTGTTLMKDRSVKTTLTILVLMVLISPAAQSQHATSDWPLFQGDARHSGVSNFEGLKTSPDESNLRWRFATSSHVYSFPVIGLDGTIFIADMGGEVYALDMFGNLKWSYDVGAGVRATPAVSKNGRLIVANRDGFVYAFDCGTGIVKWIFVSPGRIHSPPVFDGEGNVIFGSGDGYLYSVDEITGYFNWKAWTGPIGPVSPCLDSEGNIYIASRDVGLYSFYPDGTERWLNIIDGDPRSPAIDENDVIYVPHKGGQVTAYYSDGEMKWQTETNTRTRASGAIHPDGYYLLPTFEESIIILDLTTGEKIREIHLLGDCEFPPVIGNDGSFYLGTLANFYAFSAEGQVIWEQEAKTVMNVSPIMDAGGGFYEVGDGVLFAYGERWPEIEVFATDSVYAQGDSIHVYAVLMADQSDTSSYDLKSWYKPPGSGRRQIFDYTSKTQGYGQVQLNMLHDIVDEDFPPGQYYVTASLQENTTGYILDEASKIIEVTEPPD